MTILAKFENYSFITNFEIIVVRNKSNKQVLQVPPILIKCTFHSVKKLTVKDGLWFPDCLRKSVSKITNIDSFYQKGTTEGYN